MELGAGKLEERSRATRERSGVKGVDAIDRLRALSRAGRRGT